MRLGLIALLLLGCFLSFTLAAESSEQHPSREAVIDDVAKATGATGDALQALLKKKPELFDTLGDTLTAIKVVSLFTEAKDTEALTEIAKWQLGKGVDAILTKFVSPSALNALAAVRAYATALELIRDYVTIPAFDEAIYKAYKQQREGDARFASGGGDPIMAFGEATVLKDSGYYVVKPAMIEKYIRARYKVAKDGAGERMVADAEKTVDQFWQSRLETRFQQELIQRQAEAIQKRLAEAREGQLAAIRSALGSTPAATSAATSASSATAEYAAFAGDARMLRPKSLPTEAKEELTFTNQTPKTVREVDWKLYRQKEGGTEQANVLIEIMVFQADTQGDPKGLGAADDAERDRFDAEQRALSWTLSELDTLASLERQKDKKTQLTGKTLPVPDFGKNKMTIGDFIKARKTGKVGNSGRIGWTETAGDMVYSREVLWAGNLYIRTRSLATKSYTGGLPSAEACLREIESLLRKADGKR